MRRSLVAWLRDKAWSPYAAVLLLGLVVAFSAAGRSWCRARSSSARSFRLRVPDLAAAARFYTWLLGVAPKEWTHRYATFVSEALRTNFVLLVSDGKELHQDTLYHLGVDVGTKDAVTEAQHRAYAAGLPIHKPARTTWRGTPLHELWLIDPGGNLIEIYARLTDAELAEMPADQEPVFLARLIT